MSGHSKWHSIKYQKAAADAKKGAIFTRIARNITVAARESGSDPETNFKLRVAVEQARAANMPKDNVERAIKRGTGEDNEGQFQENTYEGYGPGGVAIIIRTVTDNVNRTVSNVRQTLQKHGGSMGESKSVLWNFELKGVLRFEAQGIHPVESRVAGPPKAAFHRVNHDELELAAIDAGADDIVEDEDGIMITTEPKNLENLRRVLESRGVKVEYSDIEYIAKNKVAIDETISQKLNKLTEALDDLEDVNDYYTNANSDANYAN